MQNLAALFILATLVEGIVEYFISTPNKNQPWLKYVAALVGILVCVVYKMDLLAILGVTTTIPYVGSVLTGIAVGRGSNYLNDLVSNLQVLKTQVTVQSPTSVQTDTTIQA